MFALTRLDTSVMKGIAICAMLFHHLYGCPPDGVAPYSGVLAWLGVLGKICVALFLFCSGYGLAANYKPQSVLGDLKFIVKRLVKFYANYWVIFLIFVPITIFVFHRSLADAYGEDSNILLCLLKDIIGIQGFDSYNITWWFNLLIIILYVLFPLLCRSARKIPWLVLLCSLIMMRLAYHLPANNLDVFTMQFPFVAGIVWKVYDSKFEKISTWLSDHRIIFAAGSVVLLIVFIILRMYPIIPRWSMMRMDGFIACATAMVVVSIIRCLPYAMSIFAYLGKHAMNIYMIHTFFNVYWHPEWLHTAVWMRGGVNFVALMTICLLISIGIEFLKEKIRLYEIVQNITKRI